MTEREQLQDIQRELMVVKADYDDFMNRLDKIAKKITILYEKMDDKLNRKDNENG